MRVAVSWPGQTACDSQAKQLSWCRLTPTPEACTLLLLLPRGGRPCLTRSKQPLPPSHLPSALDQPAGPPHLQPLDRPPLHPVLLLHLCGVHLWAHGRAAMGHGPARCMGIAHGGFALRTFPPTCHTLLHATPTCKHAARCLHLELASWARAHPYLPQQQYSKTPQGSHNGAAVCSFLTRRSHTLAHPPTCLASRPCFPSPAPLTARPLALPTAHTPPRPPLP